MQRAGQLCYLSRLPEPVIEISTMSLDTEAVRKIAHLARLGVEESENELYARNLSDILSFIEQLNSADTRDIEPMAHPLDASQRLHADEMSETNQREKFQRIAPRTEAGLYLVPKVID